MGQTIGPGGGMGIGQQLPPLDLEDPVLTPEAVLNPDAPEEYEDTHAGYPQAAHPKSEDPDSEEAEREV